MILLYLMVAAGVYIGCRAGEKTQHDISTIHAVLIALLWPILVGAMLVNLYEKEDK